MIAVYGCPGDGEGMARRDSAFHSHHLSPQCATLDESSYADGHLLQPTPRETKVRDSSSRSSSSKKE